MAITYVETWDYGSAVRVAAVIAGAPSVVTTPTWQNHGYAMKLAAAAGKCAAEMYSALGGSGLGVVGAVTNDWCTSFAFYPDDIPDVNIPFAFGVGTNPAFFWMKTTGELGISYLAAGAVTWGAVPLVEDTQYIVSISDPASTVNGNMQIKLYDSSGTLLETITLARGGATGEARWAIGNNQTNATFDFKYDALIVEYQATGDPFGNLGYGGHYDCMVLIPTADGDTAGIVAGTFADVDEIPCDGSTTKITEGANAAYKNVKTWSGWASVTAIAAVMGLVRVTGNAGTRPQAHLTYKSGASSSNGAQFGCYLSDDYSAVETYRGKLFLTDPDTAAAWTKAGVEAFQQGVYQELAGDWHLGYSQGLLQVVYKPAAGQGIAWWF